MHICNFENLDLHFSLHSCAIFMIEPEFESESESEVAVPKKSFTWYKICCDRWQAAHRDIQTEITSSLNAGRSRFVLKSVTLLFAIQHEKFCTIDKLLQNAN